MAKTNPSPTFPAFPGGAYVPTPSDTAAQVPGVLYVGSAGSVKVTTEQGDDVTFAGMQAGQCVPVRIVRVWATGLTAGNLVMVY